MPHDLHPRLLRGFVATAETLHFGRAAERLHVAQQALSRDVRTLERLLGDTLFLRTTRSVELTTAGHGLLPKARRLLALHDEILAGVAHRPLLLDLNSDVTGPDLTSDRLLQRPAPPGRRANCWPVSTAGWRPRPPNCSPIGWTCRSAATPDCPPWRGTDSPSARSGWRRSR